MDKYRYRSPQYLALSCALLVFLAVYALPGCVSEAPEDPPTPSIAPTSIPPSATLTHSPEPSTTPTLTPTDTASPTTSPSLTETPTPTPEPVLCEIAVNQGLLLSGPGSAYAFIGQLPMGFLLELVGRDEEMEWLVVRLVGGMEGWIRSEDVTTNAELSLLPAYPAPPVPPPTSTPEPVPIVILAPPSGYSATVIQLTFIGFVPGSQPRLTITNLTTGEVSSDEAGLYVANLHYSLGAGYVIRGRLSPVGENGKGTVKLRIRESIEPGQYLFTVVGSDGRTGSAVFTVLEQGE